MKRILIAAGAVLALAGCSKSGVHQDGDTVTVTSEDGTKAVVGQGVAPSHLPDYVKVYPGAKVNASVNNGVAGTLAMEVGDPPDKVIDFYKQQAAAAKLSSVTEVNESGQGGGHMMVFTEPGGKRTLSVTAQVTDGKTEVGLTYGG